jgi:hypothetical protein
VDVTTSPDNLDAASVQGESSLKPRLYAGVATVARIEGTGKEGKTEGRRVSSKRFVEHTRVYKNHVCCAA